MALGDGNQLGATIPKMLLQRLKPSELSRTVPALWHTVYSVLHESTSSRFGRLRAGSVFFGQVSVEVSNGTKVLPALRAAKPATPAQLAEVWNHGQRQASPLHWTGLVSA